MKNYENIYLESLQCVRNVENNLLKAFNYSFTTSNCWMINWLMSLFSLKEVLFFFQTGSRWEMDGTNLVLVFLGFFYQRKEYFFCHKSVRQSKSNENIFWECFLIFSVLGPLISNKNSTRLIKIFKLDLLDSENKEIYV